jgi:oleandomycin transport system ATP-binding protein
MTYAIQAEGLVKRFGETRALAGVDLAARTGTVLAVLGPNGAGKTTAVRILATLLRPDEGQATVAGSGAVPSARSSAVSRWWCSTSRAPKGPCRGHTEPPL